MFCNQCGALINSDSKFCPECGAAVQVSTVTPDQAQQPRVYPHDPQQSVAQQQDRYPQQNAYQQNAYPQDYYQQDYYQQDYQQGYCPPQQVINVNTNVQPVGQHSTLVAFLLCLFFGTFGAHRFYVGKVGTGLLWLFTLGLCGVGWLFDLLGIIFGWFHDKAGMRLV